MKKNPWLFRVYRGLYYPNLPKYIGPDFFLKEYLEGIWFMWFNMMIWCFLFRPFLSMERANWYSFKRLRIYVIISTALSLILLGAWLAMSWVVHARCPGNCFPGCRQNMQNCCICQGPEGVTTADEAGHLSNWYQLEIGFVFRKSVWWIRLDTLRPCFSLRGRCTHHSIWR